MRRRGLMAVLFAMWLLAGTAASAAAASTPAPTPAPAVNPPPGCFVMKNGALPTCEQNPDGSWTALYPSGATVKVDPKDSGSTVSGGTSETKRDVEIAIVVAAFIGIGMIVWWNWIRPRSRAAAPAPLPVVSPPPLPNPPASPGPQGSYFASPPDDPPPQT